MENSRGWLGSGVGTVHSLWLGHTVFLSKDSARRLGVPLGTQPSASGSRAKVWLRGFTQCPGKSSLPPAVGDGGLSPRIQSRMVVEVCTEHGPAEAGRGDSGLRVQESTHCATDQLGAKGPI